MQLMTVSTGSSLSSPQTLKQMSNRKICGQICERNGGIKTQTKRTNGAKFAFCLADFADFGFSWNLQHMEGADFRGNPHKTADFRRKPQETAEFRRNQEPQKGGFSKGSFCRDQGHGQGNKKYPRALAPAVHLALRAPQPREAYILRKPPFSWFLKKRICHIHFVLFKSFLNATLGREPAS